MSRLVEELFRGRDGADGYICGICGREYEDEGDALECYYSCVGEIDEEESSD